jgi:hypothetical protein
MRYAIRWALAAGLTVLMVGCSKSGPSGKYTMQGGVLSIEFKDGKAILSSDIGGHESETDDYTVEGNVVTVKGKTGDVKLTIMQDGSLEGNLGTFKKAAS